MTTDFVCIRMCAGVFEKRTRAARASRHNWLDNDELPHKLLLSLPARCFILFCSVLCTRRTSKKMPSRLLSQAVARFFFFLTFFFCFQSKFFLKSEKDRKWEGERELCPVSSALLCCMSLWAFVIPAATVTLRLFFFKYIYTQLLLLFASLQHDEYLFTCYSISMQLMHLKII